MYCRICGARKEDKPKWFDCESWVKFYPNKHMSLCKPCAVETPDKVSKDEFIKAYFAGDLTVPAQVIKDFYEDYLASTCETIEEYISQTREHVG